MEKDKDIKMIEFIKNTDDHLQVIDALTKEYKVQNLWCLFLMVEILISTLNIH